MTGSPPGPARPRAGHHDAVRLATDAQRRIEAAPRHAIDEEAMQCRGCRRSTRRPLRNSCTKSSSVPATAARFIASASAMSVARGIRQPAHEGLAQRRAGGAGASRRSCRAAPGCGAIEGGASSIVNSCADSLDAGCQPLPALSVLLVGVPLRTIAAPAAVAVLGEQRFERRRTILRRGRAAHADDEHAIEAARIERRAERDAQRHADLLGGVEVDQPFQRRRQRPAGPLPGRAAARCRLARHRVRARDRPGTGRPNSVRTTVVAGDQHDRKAVGQRFGARNRRRRRVRRAAETRAHRRRDSAAPWLGSQFVGRVSRTIQPARYSPWRRRDRVPGAFIRACARPRRRPARAAPARARQ